MEKICDLKTFIRNLSGIHYLVGDILTSRDYMQEWPYSICFNSRSFPFRKETIYLNHTFCQSSFIKAIRTVSQNVPEKIVIP